VKAAARIATVLGFSGASRSQRRAVAIRDTSPCADGSGAPSRRRRQRATLALAAALFGTLVLLVASAFASKEAYYYFGNTSGSGGLGGQFNSPRDTAVNVSGVGPANPGDLYVADQSNHRVQRFDSSGNFISAWGADVNTPSGGNNFEVCTTAAECKSGVSSGGNGTTAGNGTFNRPAGIAVDGDTGNVYVADASNRRIDEYDGAGTFIRSFGWNVVASGTDNNAEFQTVSVDASGGTFKLSFGAGAPTETGSIAYNASAAAVQTELEGLGDIGAGDVAVSGPAGGPWTVRFIGTLGNVNQPNLGIDGTLLTGDNPAIAGSGPAASVTEVVPGASANNYEICEAGTTDVCQAGSGGSGAGRFGSGTTFGGTFGIAVSQPDGAASVGTVFLADSGNRRVTTYSLDGTSFSSFGSASNFEEEQPRKVAVDSRGIVYASNTKGFCGANQSAVGCGTILRYDSKNANGGGVGFLAPIVAPVPAVNEAQLVALSGVGGSDKFTLTCPNGETTDPIEPGTIAATGMEIALEAKCGPSVSTSVTFGGTQITFEGNFAGTNVPQMICTVLSGPGTCTVTTQTNGAPAVPGPLLSGKGTNSASPTASFATSGLSVDPDSDGAGPDKDVLYVLRDPVFGNTRVQQFGPTNAPGLTTAPTETDDTHGASAGFGEVQGLGLNDATGTLYVSATNGVGGTGSGHRVYVLKDSATIPAPTAEMTEVSGISESNATLAGTVDPEGGNVNCKFQYATDPEFTDATDVADPDCASLANGGGPQAVSQEATGLVPNTTYFVRLVASRAFLPSSSGTSPSLKVFTTKSVPPVVTEVGAVDVEDTSARLVATIDPRHSETGYVFEYGTTPSLGSSTPPVNIGSGSTPLVVSQVVTGLAKDTTYFFRVTATNAFGATASTQATLHTRAQPSPLPDNRAYEQVTPPDKNFGDAVPAATARGLISHAVAVDGQGFAFGSLNAFGNPPGQVVNQEQTRYTSLRDASGWHTQRIEPNVCPNDVTKPELGLWWFERAAKVSAEVDHAFVPVRESTSCATPPLSAQAPLPATNMYRADFTPSSVGYDLLAPEFDFYHELGIASFTANYGAASDDFGHVFFISNGHQTADAPIGEEERLFEWDHGTVRLVSIDPSGNPFTTFYSRPAGTEDQADARNAASANGERIYFYANTPTIYMREGGTTTYDIGETECTASCGFPNFKIFEWASKNGDAAVFQSSEKLVDSDNQSGNDLYIYRHSPNPTVEANLTLISRDSEPADGSSPGVAEQGSVLGMSDDGNEVFFQANGQLVPGKTTAPGPKIYRWSWNDGSPKLEYLASATYEEQEPPGTEGAHWERRVSRDGSALLLETRTRVDPVADHDEDFDVYLWRAGKGWSCVSCQQPGTPSGGPSTTGRTGVNGTTLSLREPVMATELQTAMSAENGERVFFRTEDSLVPEDVNGPCTFDSEKGFYPCSDVYEWHDGKISLITPGTFSGELNLIGSSDSGEDVFFYTRERLVGWDQDNLIDVYDARVNGGLPEPPVQPPACEGEACRGQGTTPAANTGAGTAVFQGPSDPTPKFCKPNQVRKKSGKCVNRKKKKKHHKRHHVRHANFDRRAGK
jgi:hypothetical protein